jgi:diguanylate cyclase
MGTNPEMDRLVAIIETQTEIAAARLELDETLELIVRRAQELTKAGGGIVEILDGDQLTYLKAVDSAAGYEGRAASASLGLSSVAMRTGEAIRCDDSENDVRVDKELCRALGARSVVCVPVVQEGQPLGVLKVLSPKERAFDEGDVQTLQLLSSLVAAALSQAARFAARGDESRHDRLTDLGNKAAYDQRLVVEFERAKRYGHALSLVILDLDGFARVNEKYGHHEGDEVLRKVASLIRQTRASDDCFRIGSDEFAILMPSTPRDGAELAASRLRNLVDAAELCEGIVSINFGVAEASGGDDQAFHAEAYDALYAAKLSDGRDAAAGGAHA